MVKKYKKKPIEVEAIQWTGMNFKEIKKFCGDYACLFANQLVVDSNVGNIVVNVGEYVIKGVRDEFYPCNPDIFKLIQEEVV